MLKEICAINFFNNTNQKGPGEVYYFGEQVVKKDRKDSIETSFDPEADIKEWSSEEVIIPYFYAVDKKYHRYFPDMKIVMEDKTILVEIKPEKETHPPTGQRRTKHYIAEGLSYIRNMNKWEAANDFAKDRGWDFQIWTEKTLQEMKLLQGPAPGKLGKYKPYKPFRKKRRKKL